MWSAHTLVELSAGDVRSAQVLLSVLQKRQLCFWCFYILLSIICLNCTHVQLFLVYGCFAFCCSRRRSSRYKPFSQGSQVPSPSLS